MTTEAIYLNLIPGSRGGDVAGVALGVDDPQTLRVIVYAEREATWTPSAAITPDTVGAWRGTTPAGTTFMAALVEASFQPPASATEPPAVGDGVLAITTANPALDPALALSIEPDIGGGLIAGQILNVADPRALTLELLVRDDGAGTWTDLGAVEVMPDGTFSRHVRATASVGLVLTHADDPGQWDGAPSLPAPGGDVVASTVLELSARPPRHAFTTRPGSWGLVDPTAFPSIAQLGSDDFTIETWVRPMTPGPLFSFNALSAGGGYWTTMAVGLQDDGSVLFGVAQTLSASTSRSAEVRSRPLHLTDDSWHHVAAVRTAETLVVYVDGERVTGDTSLSEAATLGEVELPNIHRFFVGHADPFGPSGAPPLFPFQEQESTCAFNEVRLWRRALTEREIVGGMFHTLSGNEPDLLGYWPFEESSANETSISSNHASDSDSSMDLMADTHGKLTNDSDVFTSEVPTLWPLNQPYLVVQSAVLDDYLVPEDGPLTTQQTYRVDVSVRSGQGTPLPCALVVASENDVALWLDQAWAAVAPGKPVEVTTNPGGVTSFAVVAETLVAGALRIRAPFMTDDEWVVVSPERQAHESLARITPTELTKHVLPATASTTMATALASGVNQLMLTCTDHDIEANHPIVRDRPLVDVDVVAPAPHNYENPYVARVPYDPTSNVQTSHYYLAPEPDVAAATLRILAPEEMVHPNWCLDFVTESFTPLSDAEADSALDGLPLEFGPGDDHAALALANDGTPIPHADALRAWTATRKRGWLSDWFDEKLAVADRVYTRTKALIVEGVEETVHVVVLVAEVLEDGISQAYAEVIDTLRQGTAAVAGFLERVEASVEDALAYVRRMFDWGDILNTQRAIQKHISSVLPAVTSTVADLDSTISQRLDALKTAIDEVFDQALERNETTTLDQGRRLASSVQPDNIEAGYVQRLVTTYADSDQTSLGTLDDDGTTYLETLIGDLTNGFGATGSAFHDAVHEAGLGGLLSDPDRLFRLGINEILVVMKTLLDLAIDLLKTLAGAAMHLLAQGLQLMDEILSAKLSIPVITTLYRDVITDGQDLTLYSLFALLGAVPTTVAYKLRATNGAAPFSSDDVEFLESMSSTGYLTWYDQQRCMAGAARLGRRGKDPFSDTARNISFGLGATFVAALAIWGTLTVLEDTKVIGTVGGRFRVAAAVVAQVAAAPTFIISSHTGPEIYDLSIWATQFLPLLFEIPFTRDTSVSVGPISLVQFNVWNDVGSPICNTAYGVLHLLAFTGLFIYEEIEGETDGYRYDMAAKYLGNVFSTLPEVFQFAKLVPQLRPAVPVIDGVGFGFWAAIATGRLVADGVESLFFEPR